MAGRKIVSYLSRTISTAEERDRLKTNSETTREEIDSLSLSLKHRESYYTSLLIPLQ